MNIDEIDMLKKLDQQAQDGTFEIADIKEKVWEKLYAESNVIEVDSFSYLAVACAVAAIVLLFFSVDILSSIQSNVVWEISDSVNNFL